MALFVKFSNPLKTQSMKGDFHFCWYDNFLGFVARCHPRLDRGLIQKMVDNPLCEGDPRFHGDDNFCISYSFLLYKLRAMQHTRNDISGALNDIFLVCMKKIIIVLRSYATMSDILNNTLSYCEYSGKI